MLIPIIPNNDAHFRLIFKFSQKITLVYDSDQAGIKAAQRCIELFLGRGLIDLTGVDPAKSRRKTDVNTVFGVSTIRIDPKKPVRVVATSAFGHVLLPNENTITFGNTVYETPHPGKGRDFLEIQARVVFGRLVVEEE